MFRFIAWAAIAAAFLFAVIWALSCSAIKPTVRVVELAVPTCVQIAEAHGRHDLAQVCIAGGDIAAIIDAILAENIALKARLSKTELDGGTRDAASAR